MQKYDNQMWFSLAVGLGRNRLAKASIKARSLGYRVCSLCPAAT